MAYGRRIMTKGTSTAAPHVVKPRPAEGKYNPRPAEQKAIRAEKVARARRLIADPAYPPREILEKVGQKLMRDMGSKGVLARDRRN